MENWKEIKGYEGLYSISDRGRVKSLIREITNTKGVYRKYPEKIIKGCVHSQGYLKVCLCKNSVIKIKYIHSLVCEAFLYIDSKRNLVNHKNGIKDDNRVENLEWVTNSENGLHSYKYLNRKATILEHRGKYILDTQTGVFYENSKELCDLYGFNINTFRIRMRGKLRNNTKFIYANN